MQHVLSDTRIYFGLVLVLVAVTAFGLGRLAEQSTQHVPSGTQTARVIQTQMTQPDEATTVVASKNGTKYHLPWCAGAQQMSEENKIYFS
jgi:hypothetical protein